MDLFIVVCSEKKECPHEMLWLVCPLVKTIFIKMIPDTLAYGPIHSKKGDEISFCSLCFGTMAGPRISGMFLHGIYKYQEKKSNQFSQISFFSPQMSSSNIKDLFNTKLDPRTNNSDSFLVHTYDATDQNSSKEWVDKTFEIFKSIDTIIHCAGIFKRTNLLFNDNEMKDIEDLWKVNVMGPWILTKHAWKYLSLSNSISLKSPTLATDR